MVTANININQVAERVNNIREFSSLPIAVGFGVRDAETAKQVSLISDAVVIGSRIINEVENSTQEDLLGRIRGLLSEIKSAIS